MSLEMEERKEWRKKQAKEWRKEQKKKRARENSLLSKKARSRKANKVERLRGLALSLIWKRQVKCYKGNFEKGKRG